MAINTLFRSIAIAIREKAQTTGSITPSEMPDAIRAIPSGGGGTPTLAPLTANEMTIPDQTIIGGTYRASASSVYNTDTQPFKPFRGINAMSNDCWHASSTAVPQWLQIEFPKKACLREFTMANRAGYLESPSKFKLQGSNNGETWDDLTDILDFAPYGAVGYVKTYPVDNDTYYNFYRWYVTASNSYCVISWIRFDEIDVEV